MTASLSVESLRVGAGRSRLPLIHRAFGRFAGALRSIVLRPCERIISGRRAAHKSASRAALPLRRCTLTLASSYQARLGFVLWGVCTLGLVQPACANRKLSVPDAPEGARCLEDGQCIHSVVCGGAVRVCVGGRCVAVDETVTPCLQTGDLVFGSGEPSVTD